MKIVSLLSSFGVYFFVVLNTSVDPYSFDGHGIVCCTFTKQAERTDYVSNRTHGDFAYNRNFGECNTFSHHTSRFDKYTVDDFKDHFDARGYTESEVLNQPCLYMSDEFVKHAQTYLGYKNKIREMYAELQSLTFCQKTCRVAQGTYCRKLQKRIADLYRSLDTIKAEPLIDAYYKTVDSGEKTFKSTVLASFAEYKTLESVYKYHTPNLAQAINARSVIYKNSLDNSSYLQETNKSYNLNGTIKKLLSRYGHTADSFTYCYGNQLQQTIHQESLDILTHVDNLTSYSVLYDHQEALVDMASSIIDYNYADMSDKAMSVADLCWTLLDYGQAIAEGAAVGLYSAAHDILTNPIEATVSIVAGKQVLAFQLCKVLYNVADIGVTAISDYDHAQEKWNKYAEPLNNIIDAINKKEITVRDAIKGSTAFVVGYKAQGKLLGGLGKFCNTIKHKSINFVKNNQLLSPQEYLTTPEGLLFKATTQSNKFQQATSASLTENLNNSVEKLTRTVWKNIKPTDPMYPGTKIPKSFELTVGKERFWICPSATKHMRDYITKRQPAYTMPIDSQILLTAFEAAVKQAVAEGIVWRSEIIVKSWQFGFDLSKKEGLLPTIYHANFKPEGWLANKKYSKII